MQISSEIIEVLEYLGQKFGIAIDWTAKNVQPYLEELVAKFIAWETQTSIAWIVIMGAISVIALIGAILTHIFGDGELMWWIFGITLFVAIIVISVQVFDIIECRTFPEKAIFDYIQLHKN